MDVLTNEILYQKTPQELTALLYEGLISNLEEAVDLIDQKDFIRTNKKLQKANDILHRLGVGIKYEAGPIAEQLDTLYNFMASQIIKANIHKDKQGVQNVIKMIQPIASAWNEILKKKTHNQSSFAKKATAYENSIMRTTY
ncbi:MAG: flagellar export chaperone FliS [Bacillota bacterium]|nr:flagellar export chaperone FliS [Bacillota bacterium]